MTEIEVVNAIPVQEGREALGVRRRALAWVSLG